MQLEHLTPAIGSEVHGIDLSDAAQIDACAQPLREALAQRQVLFFRNQALEPDAQVRFARLFGGVEPVSSTFPSHPLNPHVELLVSTGPRTGTDIWHTDLTWQKTPPAAACLYAVDVPETGGDTMWSSMTAAFDALAPAMQGYLRGLSAIHDWEAPALTDSVKAQDPSGARYRALREKYPPIDQPVVYTHPRTGRPVVFVNALYTRHIRDLSQEESSHLIDWLSGMAKVPERQVRFRWRKGSVAVWDNLATQHYAVNDYYPAARRMHRVAIRQAGS